MGNTLSLKPLLCDDTLLRKAGAFFVQKVD
jgi:hypothetical protein